MISEYGIKVLWAGWRDDPRIGFSDKGFADWADKISVGTRMLLYETERPRPGQNVIGIKSIMAEVQVAKMFDEVKELTPPTQQHEHLILVDILRNRDSVTPIPLRRIKQITKQQQFPFQMTYLPLDEQTYNRLLQEWDR